MPSTGKANVSISGFNDRFRDRFNDQLNVRTTALERAFGSSKLKVNEFDLQMICNRINGFVGVTITPISNDGYRWYCALNFEIKHSENAELKILLPWVRHAKLQILERPVAVVAKGTVADSVAQRIVDDVCTEMKTFAKTGENTHRILRMVG